MSLKCPVCKHSLCSVHYEGVRVQLCMTCKGFFLKPGALKRIQEVQEVEVSMDMPAPSRSGDKLPRLCPACDLAMVKRKYGKVSSTIIDLCEKCKGLWLDKGELERIQLDYEVVQANRSAAKAPPKRGAVTVAAPASIQCPKCGQAQPEAEQCTRCGIVFAKFAAAQREIAAAEDAEQRNAAQIDDVFKAMKGVEIQQVRDLVESLTSLDRKNRYSLRIIGANDTWRAQESGGRLGMLWRSLFGSLHRTEVEILDANQNLVMRIERRVRFLFAQCELFSRDGKKLGSVSRVFAPLNRWFEVKNAAGKLVMRIKGPVFSPWTFIAYARNKEVAQLHKKWAGWFTEWITEADRYSLRFSAAITTGSKQLLLGAAFLIDYTYFENYGEKESLIFRTWRSSPLIMVSTLFVVIFAITLFGKSEFFTHTAALQVPTVLADVQRKPGVSAKREIEFKTLVEGKRAFVSLAKKGYYTIVEVYLDSCPLCRKLESGFKPLLKKRKDVYIRRVHFPEDGLHFSFDGNTQDEVNAQMEEINTLMQSYDVCGTPHVLVFGPDKQTLAADSCKKRDGTLYLQNWINAETGLLVKSSGMHEKATPLRF